jgi:hypothetical protein
MHGCSILPKSAADKARHQFASSIHPRSLPGIAGFFGRVTDHTAIANFSTELIAVDLAGRVNERRNEP